MSRVPVTRHAELPDRFRIERSLRLPEYGPRILFFSGGNALRETSRELKRYTHNSVHLITPFDSGGSSAKLRESFGMLSIGDLRNRLMALADESAMGGEALTRLFARRLAEDEDDATLRQRLDELAAGESDAMEDLPRPIRHIVATHLNHFRARMPESFNLRGANLGNLVLAGGLLFHDGDVDANLYLFSRLVQARGTVLPIITGSYQLRGQLADGRTLVGQHLLTGKEVPPLDSPIVEFDLVSDDDHQRSVHPTIRKQEAQLIARSDLIVFPMGSFYSSVLANLLPSGVGQAVRQASCPKIFIPSAGRDPELLGKTLGDTVEALLLALRRDAGAKVPADQLVDYLLLDPDVKRYALILDLDRVRALGVKIVHLPLGGSPSEGFSPRRICELLVSIS